jgi:4-amino-4-deoxy-L-arabinose transferase-like glycosyltransferase
VSTVDTIPVSSSSAAPEDGTVALPRFAVREVAIVATAFVAVELAVAARYGLHRDELYFLACARHLAWGYVDQPPFVAVVARVAVALFGASATSLRVVPALGGAAAVVLTAAMARELHGGRRAQLLAAIAAATSAQVLGATHLLSTAGFDMLAWAVISFLVLRALRTGDERLWLAVGAAAGVGLLNKYNVLFLLFGLAVGLVASGRADVFRRPWVWAGGGLALLIWSPNLVWNAQHDWASLSMMQSLHRENSTLGASFEFVPLQLLVVGPVLAPFWIAGLRRCFRDEIARTFGFAYVTLLVVYTLSGAKSYYLGGIYFVLFASGGVWLEQKARAGRARPRRWIVAFVAGAIISMPLAIPVLPESLLAKGSWQGQINKDLSATVGWPTFVRQVAGIASNLSPRARARLVVITGDYGAAGAVDLFGARYGLPPAISGHNSYWWWGTHGASNDSTAIAVNMSRADLLRIFSDVEPAGSVGMGHGGVWTEERGEPIWVCRGQRVPWSRAWPDLRHYG